MAERIGLDEQWDADFQFNRAIWLDLLSEDLPDELLQKIQIGLRTILEGSDLEVENFLVQVEKLTDYYAFNMHNQVYEASPKPLESSLNSIKRNARKLSSLLLQGDVILRGREDKRFANYFKDLDDKLEKHFWLSDIKNGLSNVTSDSEMNIAEYRTIIDTLRSEVIKESPSDNLAIVTNNCLAHMHEQLYDSGVLSHYYISFILERLTELNCCLDYLLEDIKHVNKDGAGQDIYTGKFLCELHELYQSHIESDSIDKSYYLFAKIILNMVADDIKVKLDQPTKTAIQNMSEDAIRKKIVRYRENPPKTNWGGKPLKALVDLVNEDNDDESKS